MPRASFATVATVERLLSRHQTNTELFYFSNLLKQISIVHRCRQHLRINPPYRLAMLISAQRIIGVGTQHTVQHFPDGVVFFNDHCIAKIWADLQLRIHYRAGPQHTSAIYISDKSLHIVVCWVQQDIVSSALLN